jgi:3-dehydroquinate synthase
VIESIAPRVASDAGPAQSAPGQARCAFEVSVRSEVRYPVVYESGLLARYGAMLVGHLGVTRAVVLTDTRVQKLYGAELLRSFAAAGVEPPVLAVPDGERSKDMKTLTALLGRLAALGFDRHAVLVNFGGGVICDLGGFLASAYMRGVRYANFSTSLIGQLDASIGGKVAVNAPEAKNLIGAFHHPVHVAGDPALLRTLSARDFRSGIAEAIKVAIIASPEYFAFLETQRPAIRSGRADVLIEVVGAAARLKMDLVSADPYENDLARPLNFGHTIGHPIETEFGYRKIRHGEAVAIGMGVATAISLRKGIIAPDVGNRIFEILRAYDLLGLGEAVRPDSVVQHMRYVKMIRGNRLRFVLPRRIGEVLIVDDLSDADIVRGFEDYDAAVRARTTS